MFERFRQLTRISFRIEKKVVNYGGVDDAFSGRFTLSVDLFAEMHLFSVYI
jgi:hypothetical protein